eukprot:gene1431-2050_t
MGCTLETPILLDGSDSDEPSQDINVGCKRKAETGHRSEGGEQTPFYRLHPIFPSEASELQAHEEALRQAQRRTDLLKEKQQEIKDRIRHLEEMELAARMRVKRESRKSAMTCQTDLLVDRVITGLTASSGTLAYCTSKYFRGQLLSPCSQQLFRLDWTEDRASRSADCRVLSVADSKGTVPMKVYGFDGNLVTWGEAWAKLQHRVSVSTEVHPSVEIFTIPAEDDMAPPALRDGQSKGLRVHSSVHKLGKGTLIGMYDGWVALNNAEYSVRVAVGVHEKAYESYAVEFDRWNDLNQKALEGDSLLITAYGEGRFNAMKYINDISYDPMNGIHPMDRLANVRFVEVEVDGWPYLLVITIADIMGGDEILLAYGNDYWKGMQKVHERHSVCRQQLVQLVKGLQDNGSTNAN